MPDYRLDLHDGPSHTPIAETIAARDDAEALELAQVRLLLTPDYTHIRVRRGQSDLGRLERDSLRARPATGGDQ